MKRIMFIAFLAITLVACASAQPNATEVLNTAIAMAQTSVPLTLTALPTVTPPAPTVTPSATVVVILPTPPPTQPPVPILTPDTIEVEQWKEYQAELAKALFVYNPSFPIWGYGPDAYTDALCEWDILMRSGQEVYVWATCTPAANSPLKGMSRVNRQNPAVVYLKPDGSIREISAALEKTDSRSQLLIYNLHLFPVDLQKTLCLYYFINALQCYEIIPAYIPFPLQSRQSTLALHLKYREIYPDEPPLVVLSAMPMATPTP